MDTTAGTPLTPARLRLKIFVTCGLAFGVGGVAVMLLADSNLSQAVRTGLVLGTATGLFMSLVLGRLATSSTRGAGPRALECHQTRTIELPGEPSDALLRMSAAVSALPRCRRSRTDPLAGEVHGRTGISWKSWGEIVVARVESLGADRQQVVIESRPWLQLRILDYGANAANVDRIAKTLG